MREKLGRLALGIAAALSLCACTAGQKLLVTQKLPDQMAQYNSVFVAVDTSLAEDVSKEIGALEVRTVSAIKKVGYSAVQIYSKNVRPRSGSLLVKATIVKKRGVSKFGRWAGGMAAGRARLVADVQILDGPSGTVLGLYTVTGESGASGFAGGTDDAVEKCGDGIAALLARGPDAMAKR